MVEQPVRRLSSDRNEKENTMQNVKLTLKKHRRHIWETEHDGEYIDFYKLPSDGLWRSSYFGKHADAYSTLKGAKLAVELALTKKARWVAKQEGE